MKAPIKDKASVLGTLRQRLYVAEIVVMHSREIGEPPSMQVNGTAAANDLREAIRFIEEHGE